MAVPEWVSYVGIVTGAIGSITGIGGAIMGYVSYRRSGQIKALDLRLELRKVERELGLLLEELPDRMEYAKKSRAAVSAATGAYQSGAFQAWSAQWDADVGSVEALVNNLPSGTIDYERLSHSELEARLNEVHSIKLLADSMDAKYRAALAADDHARDHIREDNRVKTAAIASGYRS